MKNSKSILPYLLLNILVSGLTVFLVLFFWDRTHPMPQVPEENPSEVRSATPTQTALSKSATSQALAAEVEVTVEGVFGVGDLQLEYILIRNESDQALNLAGWKAVGSPDRSYTFPNLSLNRNGAVRLYSKDGTDSVIELFWGSAQALWKPGDPISLEDPSGAIHATYVIP
ncbi:MAG: lamin tail domain-containing protein [Anaerolineaceae bacterium]